MKKYSGAVLFVDMLGIGALTQGTIQLSEEDHVPWKVPQAKVGRHHLLGAKLLMQFRRSLVHTQRLWKSVEIAQLSDCAFLWSDNSMIVVNAARELMWHTTRAGLLCRAGLAHGEIVEPDKVNRSLGRFILGDAVTSAVDLERSGKGARVFCDSEVAHEILQKCSFTHSPFLPLKNPLDGSVVDEFRWYVLPGSFDEHQYRTGKRLPTALALVDLLTILRYSPRLKWNSQTREGRLQIACTIEAVSNSIAMYVPSDDYAFTVEYLLEAADQPARSEKIRERIRTQFSNEVSELLAQSKKKTPSISE